MRSVESHPHQHLGTAHQATLTEHTLRGTARVAKFSLTVLMKEFAAFKGDLPEIIAPSVVKKHQLHKLRIYKEDRLKTDVFNALSNFSSTISEDALTFSVHPSEVRASGRIEKGMLRLAPVTAFKNISAKCIKGAPCATVNGTAELYLQEPPAMRSIAKEAEKNAESQESLVLAAFWWVSTVGKEAAANMVVKEHKDRASGVSFPIYLILQ